MEAREGQMPLGSLEGCKGMSNFIDAIHYTFQNKLVTINYPNGAAIFFPGDYIVRLFEGGKIQSLIRFREEQDAKNKAFDFLADCEESL